MSPVQIQGRKYLPMFPARDGVYTIEQVREKFLEVFSEEFTDKALNTAIANKDLLEYNGNVYAACKKNKGETSYNSWADHVQDDGDGKFVSTGYFSRSLEADKRNAVLLGPRFGITARLTMDCQFFAVLECVGRNARHAGRNHNRFQRSAAVK